VDLILIRYAELGLKSRSVRRFFETILIDNMMASLAKEGIEALINSEQGRIYVTTDSIPEAINVLTRVFGVASVSPVIESGSTMEEMCAIAAEYSTTILREGQGFAIKARREGNHPYKSMDVGREVGSAVFLANEDKHVKVNLSKPDITIYVEVRDKRAYIFSEYIPGPGGLPMGSQGKVVAVVNEERDALAAWLLMKRGCRTFFLGRPDGPIRILERWDPNLTIVEGGDLKKVIKDNKAQAVVFGYSLRDFDRIKEVMVDTPAFFPLVGMTEAEVKERLAAIKA
jgi:thiamine biosynthesis protein ThiI